MVNQLPTPAPASADAANRAWRTFAQGLLFDVLATVATVLVASVTDVRWTKEYWIGIAALIGKTIVLAIISYIARKVVPPPTS